MSSCVWNVRVFWTMLRGVTDPSYCAFIHRVAFECLPPILPQPPPSAISFTFPFGAGRALLGWSRLSLPQECATLSLRGMCARLPARIRPSAYLFLPLWVAGSPAVFSVPSAWIQFQSHLKAISFRARPSPPGKTSNALAT